MAQPVLKFKRSSVEGKVPAVSSIERGEFAINTYDGKVYILRDQSSVGIATTTVSVNPWVETSGVGELVSYSGEVACGAALSVTGDLRVTGVTTISGLTYPASDGSALQTLQTDGSGNLSFGDLAGDLTGNVTGNVTGRLTGNVEGNIFSSGISTVSGFTFPSSDGTTNESLVTDGNGNLSFKTLKLGGGAGITTHVDAYYTATEFQDEFNTPHPFVADIGTRSVQVFLNGIKLRDSQFVNDPPADFTLSGTETVTLASSCNAGDRVQVTVFYQNEFEEDLLTASTEGQTEFDLTGGDKTNVKCYVNGVKLRSTDFTVTRKITLGQGCNVGDEVDLISETAEDYFTATQNQIEFSPSNVDIQEHNLMVFVNGVRLENNDYTKNSPTITLTEGLNKGDHLDVVYRA